MKPAFAVLTIAAATGVLAGPIDRPFLIHTDIVTVASSPCASWTEPNPGLTCDWRGMSAHSGHSYSFSGAGVSVVWCTPTPQRDCDFAKRRVMPDKYVRWMMFCRPSGMDACGKTDWLLGAVQMPNGPFHVVDGMIDGVAVRPDDGNQLRIGQPGGPLNLVVTHNGDINSRTYRYSYGIIGRIKY